jgi:hypothetical protein
LLAFQFKRNFVLNVDFCQLHCQKQRFFPPSSHFLLITTFRFWQLRGVFFIRCIDMSFLGLFDCLPDELVELIFSFFSTKDAVKYSQSKLYFYIFSSFFELNPIISSHRKFTDFRSPESIWYLESSTSCVGIEDEDLKSFHHFLNQKFQISYFSGFFGKLHNWKNSFWNDVLYENILYCVLFFGFLFCFRLWCFPELTNRSLCGSNLCRWRTIFLSISQSSPIYKIYHLNSASRLQISTVLDNTHDCVELTWLCVTSVKGISRSSHLYQISSTSTWKVEFLLLVILFQSQPLQLLPCDVPLFLTHSLTHTLSHSLH